MNKTERYILDGTKLLWHLDRVKDWLDGKRVAPITMDWALTQACYYRCIYCYGQVQRNPSKMTRKAALDFLTDAAEIGVKGTTLTSDGESTLAPFFYEVVEHGKNLGIDMATATCGHPLKKEKLNDLLPLLTYLRFNVSAAHPKRYAYIHGVPEKYFEETCDIIRKCVEIKRDNNLDVTLGLQMVLMPEFGDQIVPMAKLGKKLGVDYTVIKHCSDDEFGQIGVNYDKYPRLYPLLKEAESYTDDEYFVKVKWSKIQTGKNRRYIQCYGPPLFLQTSGSGIIAPCGAFFHPRYKKYQIGNLNEERFIDMFNGERYWKIMEKLATDFDARTQCAVLCLQDKVNEFLWDIKQGTVNIDDLHPPDYTPSHINFI